MRKDESGRPRCGAQGSLLGARSGRDIIPDASNLVGRGTGGMSVTPDDPKLLPPHARPERLGGLGKLPIFGLKTDRLGEALAYRADPDAPDRHGFVEPSRQMPFEDYQAALAGTQRDWCEVP
jgi:hypothetical protein